MFIGVDAHDDDKLNVKDINANFKWKRKQESFE